jgi:lysyl-tRNA synthetase class 2
VLAGFPALEGERVSVAGRLTRLRRQGRIAFADLADASGRVQLFLRTDVLGAEPYREFVEDLDIGDIVGVEGAVARTRAGEVSVVPARFQLLAKALRPLPAKWHGLRDTEARHRRRYLDLIANPAVRERFVRRSRMLSAVRAFLDARGFLEVETPVLQTVAAGAAARPFRTHHHALDLDLHLRIALELHLKRLIVGGLEAVYEIGRVFRNEGLSSRHNPEFTMLECYQAYGDHRTMMELTEELFATVAETVCGTRRLVWQGREVDLTPPWPRVSMVEALARRGLDPLAAPSDAAARAMALEAGVDVAPTATRGQVVDALAEALLLPELQQPTFLTDHPVAISPLARARPGDPRLAERFEAVVAGMEMANGYSELNDPDEQRERFRQQAAERERGHAEAQELDEDFLRALEHGMPPTGGLGVGLDRLAMLLCDVASIREVILFPLLRPESPEAEGGA